METISVGATNVEQTLETTVTNTWSMGTVLLIVYIVMALLMIARFAWRMMRLIRIIRNSDVQTRLDYKLINTQGNLPTFSFMRYLFWDNTKELTPNERTKIINHELTHIRDFHSWDVMYMEVIKIILWFNPIIYLYDRSLKYHHEFIADAAVLKETSAKDYGKLLVQSLFKQMNLQLTHNFNQIEIKKRLAMMEKLRSPGYKFLKIFLLLPLMAMMLFAFSNSSPKVVSVKQSDSSYRFAGIEGGLGLFYKKLSKELRYPIESQRKGIEGRVFVNFKIKADGSLTQFKILKGLDEACDKEAIRAIKAVNVNWLPAKMEGTHIGQKLTIPVLFSVNKAKKQAQAKK
ncbi:hypothetical protein BKI52_24815 [marine bacterium AO1-C]|nr:hypothetical protein BKI52_24815 [marine bacterium AO1-C]